VATGRASNYSSSELDSFASSDKLEIQYYCRVNPEFSRGVALFVVIPINLAQFLKTALKSVGIRKKNNGISGKTTIN
jgi:hypothetical protein